MNMQKQTGTERACGIVGLDVQPVPASGNYEKSFWYAQQRYDFASRSNNKFWISNALYGMAQLYAL
jgi:hypothetical protein